MSLPYLRKRRGRRRCRGQVSEIYCNKTSEFLVPVNNLAMNESLSCTSEQDFDEHMLPEEDHALKLMASSVL